jgi:hypothetical protein
MSQSGFIAAMLLAAFILWLAINDRLTAYTAVLFGPTQQPTPQGNISDKGGIIAPSATAPGAGGSVTPGGTAGLLSDSGDIIDTTATDVLPLLLEAF